MTQPIGPGDVVVCVHDEDWRWLRPLTVGARYVIHSVQRGHSVTRRRLVLGVLLEGFEPLVDEDGGRWHYPIEWFRPIRDDDAEIFREMVRDVRQPETVT